MAQGNRQPPEPVSRRRSDRPGRWRRRGPQRQSGNAPQPAPGPRLKTSGLRPFQDPNSRVVAAEDRVSRLERALEAMGDRESPEVDGLRTALEKAREFAKEVFLDKQIKDGESESSFGRARERAEHRRGQHRGRRAETRKVEGPDRSSPNAASTCSSNIQRISGAAGGGYIPVMPGLIPAELYQWLEDRQTDLQEALVDGNTAH